VKKSGIIRQFKKLTALLIMSVVISVALPFSIFTYNNNNTGRVSTRDRVSQFVIKTKTINAVGVGQGPAPSSGTDALDDDDDDDTVECDLISFVFGGESFTECVLMPLANTTMEGVSHLLWLSGVLLNYAIGFSLNIGGFVETTPAVKEAWTAFRDIANMFFIFILLFIAIATILQLEKYNTKALLSKLIIVALLINFSLFFTNIVIDSSNILACSFYSSMIEGNANCSDISKVEGDGGISEKFMQGLKLQSLYNPDAEGKLKKPFYQDSRKILNVMIFGSAFMFITAFVFLAAAIMFVIRTGVLLFLMILSPLAFVGYILPKTSAHTTKWWDALIGQSFFAPIFLLMMWVVLKIVEGGTVGLGEKKTFTEAIMAADGSSAVSVIFSFALLITLIIGALVVSKNLAGGVATTSIGWANRISRFAGAQAIRPVRRVASRVANRAYVGARGMAGSAAEALQSSDHIAARAFRRIPLVTSGAAAVGAAARGDLTQAEQKYNSYSDASLKNLVAQTTTSRTDAAAIQNLLTQRGNLTPERRMSRADVIQATQTRQRKAVDTRATEQLQWQYAENVAQRAAAVQTINPAAAEQIDPIYFDTAPGNIPVIDEMINEFHGGHMQSIMNRDDDMADNFFQNLRTAMINAGIPADHANLVSWLESPAINNRRLASWATSSGGRNILRAYGF